MSEKDKDSLHLRIEMILSRSRREEEAFLTDGKSAAKLIYDMLEKENLLAKEVSVFEVNRY